MKKILISLFIFMGMMSCKDYLDIVPDDIATIDKAFNNKNSAKSYLYTCYNYLPDEGSVNSNPALCGGDEVWLYPKSYGLGSFFGSTWMYDLAHGEQNANNPIGDYWMGDRQGKNLFVGIRDCNIFLEKIEQVPDIDDFEKAQWIAEVKFLKAYYHFYLLRMYGPVPIIKENLDITSDTEEVKVERRPVSEVVNYIVSLLDEALADLPLMIENESTELGRITQPIAAAIKAKVLVLNASPIFNEGGVFDDLVSKDGAKLIDDTNNAEKWVIAKEAVKAAIDKCHEAGHELYYFKEPRVISDSTRLKMNIRGAVTERWNSELIWGSTFRSTDHLQRCSQARLRSADIGNHNAKNLLAPTMRMAEVFYTENGVPIDQDNTWNYAERFKTSTAGTEDRYYLKKGYKTANLHFDREPRFYASMAFDGSIWYGGGRFDDNSTYHLEMKARQFAGMTATERISITGYLSKKMVNYNNVVGDGSDYTIEYYPFPIIRLADLYLLHAEAANESGAPATEVFEFLDKVRERAGLEGVEKSWEDFSNNPEQPKSLVGRRKIIRTERQIEFAFEGKRFWDVRRWLTATDEMNTVIKGWNIFEESTEDFNKVVSIYNMEFRRKDYFWPIQTSEILVNNKLVQNPGW
ncbi:RagB/SusD family nutrient uptake outer membrane protein [Puteibacter caeruleilacunae]|nr:RagB/SusD family nutrient uptake outer membrane protein [Puteibacter caeruleilacunae]